MDFRNSNASEITFWTATSQRRNELYKYNEKKNFETLSNLADEPKQVH